MGFFDLLFGDGGGDTYGDEEKWRKVRDKENAQRRDQRARKKARDEYEKQKGKDKKDR